MPEAKSASRAIERDVVIGEQTFHVVFSLAGISVNDRRSLGSFESMEDDAIVRSEARMLAQSVVRWDVEVGGQTVPLTEDDILANLGDEFIDAFLASLFESAGWGKAEAAEETGAPSSSSTSSAPSTPHSDGDPERTETPDLSPPQS